MRSDILAMVLGLLLLEDSTLSNDLMKTSLLIRRREGTDIIFEASFLECSLAAIK